MVVYYGSRIAINSGTLTIIRNRVGDSIIFIIMGFVFEAHNFCYIWAFASLFSNPKIMGLILIAASTKRAQFPFRAWLPAAIAAPTPVSALVHSSTLVTAGVYILIRVLLVAQVKIGPIDLILGITRAMAMVSSRFSAIFEIDIKKVVALSTLRQLRLIITSLRLNIALLAFRHIIIHAFLKALIFLTVGVIIHNSKGYQNIISMGGKFLTNPLMARVFLRAAIALAGVPFISAFFTKEILLSYCLGGITGVLYYPCIIVRAMFTVLYRIRLIICSSIFITRRHSCLHRNEISLLSWASVFILVLPVVISGPYVRAVLSDFYILSTIIPPRSGNILLTFGRLSVFIGFAIAIPKSTFYINKNLMPFSRNLISLSLLSSRIINNRRIKYAKICKFSSSGVIFSICSKFITVKNTKNVILLTNRSNLSNFMIIFYILVSILLLFY